ncbi:hypothetical protein MRX96_041281 [Rhipicephalus microplus]
MMERAHLLVNLRSLSSPESLRKNAAAVPQVISSPLINDTASPVRLTALIEYIEWQWRGKGMGGGSCSVPLDGSTLMHRARRLSFEASFRGLESQGLDACKRAGTPYASKFSFWRTRCLMAVILKVSASFSPRMTRRTHRLDNHMDAKQRMALSISRQASSFFERQWHRQTQQLQPAGLAFSLLERGILSGLG